MSEETVRAEQILKDLEQKRAKLAARSEEISTARKAIGYATFVDGDKSARKKLDALNLEAATTNGDLESIESAISEARGRLDDAKRAESEAVDRANAVKVREGFAELAECASKLDEALADLVAQSNAFVGVVRNRIHAAGSSFPTDQQVSVNAALALSTSLMMTPWRVEFRHLSPGEKRSFSEIVARWFEPTEARIKERFGATGGRRDG